MIRLHYRPGHFLTQGHPLATVWPPEAADKIGRRLESVHITGPLRTVPEQADQADITARYDALLALHAQAAGGQAAGSGSDRHPA